MIGALRRSEPRAEIHRWRVLPGDLSKLDHESIVISGLAARDPLLDVPVLRDDPLEAYVAARALRVLRRRLKPSEDSEQPNVLLKVPAHPWVLDRGPVAPSSVIGADLLDHADARVARAGARILEERVNANRDS